MAISTANDLRALADQPEFERRRALLVSLADALDEGTGSEEWAAVDLHAALGGPISVPLDTDRKIVTGLEIARVFLIFGPILSTWAGLHFATQAYANLKPDDRKNGASFFQRWLTGFDGDLWFSFTKMTILTLLLVGMVIMVSVVIEILEAQALTPSESRHHDLSEGLAAALADATLLLARRRLSTPARFREEMTKAAQELNEVLQAVRGQMTMVRDVAFQAVTATSSSSSAVTKLSASATAMTEATTVLTTSAAAVTEATSRLRSEHADRFEELASLLKEARRALGDDLHGARDQLTQAVATVRTEQARQAASLLERVEALTAAVTTSMASTAELTARAITESGENTARAITESGNTMTASITTSSHATAVAVANTGKTTASAIADSARSTADAMTRLEATLARTTDLLGELSRRLDQEPNPVAVDLRGPIDSAL